METKRTDSRPLCNVTKETEIYVSKNSFIKEPCLLV